MKKYVKPALYYESFELSRHIADCALELEGFTTIESCHAQEDPALRGSDEWMFLTTTAACADADELVGSAEGFCYTNGSSGLNLFMS